MRKNILIVEDDEALATLYKTELELKGYKVALIRNGIEAFSAIKKEKPDLVLLDIMLPGKNGLEILEEIRTSQETKDTKIVMLTNFGSEENVSTALENGAIDYIMKYKIVPSELSEKLASLLGDATDSLIHVTN